MTVLSIKVNVMFAQGTSPRLQAALMLEKLAAKLRESGAVPLVGTVTDDENRPVGKYEVSFS